MNRRNFLVYVGVGVTSAFAGCAERSDGKPDTEGGNDLPTADQIVGVYVILLDEVYEDEPVTDHDDERIVDIEVLQSLFEETTDPDADLGTVEGADYTYETTMEGRGGDLGPDDLERAVHTLYELPQGQHPDLDQRGWYIRHPEQLFRFNYVEYA